MIDSRGLSSNRSSSFRVELLTPDQICVVVWKLLHPQIGFPPLLLIWWETLAGSGPIDYRLPPLLLPLLLSLPND